MSFPNVLIPDIQRLIGREGPGFLKMYENLTAGPIAPRMIKVYKRLDQMMGDSDNAIDCKQGCNYCCYYHVYITPVEAFTIVDEIAKRSEAERKRIEESLREYVGKVSGLGKDKHILTNIACSFLANGGCSIYSIRPLACRRHHSRDVEVCERAFEDVQSGEPSPMDPNRVVASATVENLHADLQLHMGLDCDSYEFHAAMLEALTNKASFRRWKNGKSAFPSVLDKELRRP